MKEMKRLSLPLILIGIGLVILPTATPEDLVTTVPLLLLAKNLYINILLPIGIICIVAGFLMMRF